MFVSKRQTCDTRCAKCRVSDGVAYDDKNWGKSSTHPSPYLYGRLATDMRTRRAHISNLQSCKSQGEAAANVGPIAIPLEP